MKTIVFARNIALESPICTNTHNYAIQFQRAGWNTIWVPKPATPWNRRRLGQVQPGKYGVRQRRLSFLFNFGGKGLNSFGLLWEWFPYFLMAPGRRALRAAGLLRPEIFFSGSLETASLYKLFKPGIFIYNAHDAFSLYPDAPRSLRAVEQAVLRRADLTVTTSAMTRELLLKQYGVAPERIVNLGHGVDNARYVPAAEPVALDPIPRPRAVCLGTLDAQDSALAEGIVAAVPEVSFIFIGPGGDRLRARLQRHGVRNAFFLGPIFRNDLPPYLMHCDVGLIIYDPGQRDSRRFGCNPMKRYDYAAAGLQTVSVDLHEYQKKPSPMYAVKSAEEFIAAVRRAVSSPQYSVAEIRAFASANDWTSKFETLVRHLAVLKPGWTPPTNL